MTAALPGAWTEWAACHGRVAQMALPDLRLDNGRSGGRGGYTVRQRAHITVARHLCAGCPVLVDCKAWAMTLPDPAIGMVAGGMTPRQRDDARAAGLAI